MVSSIPLTVFWKAFIPGLEIKITGPVIPQFAMHIQSTLLGKPHLYQYGDSFIVITNYKIFLSVLTLAEYTQCLRCPGKNAVKFQLEGNL